MQMPTISRPRALAYVAVLLALLVLGARLALGREPDAAPSASERPAVLRAEEAPVRRLVVHVVGAVRRPGLYRLPEGSRVDDALRRAGGPKARAELAAVNLAAPVADGQQVVVPARGAAPAGPAGIGPSATAPGGKVHLNSATLEELDTLPGIGPITAQKILDYRAANGAFRTIEELDAVPGIGPVSLEELLPLVDL